MQQTTTMQLISEEKEKTVKGGQPVLQARAKQGKARPRPPLTDRGVLAPHQARSSSTGALGTGRELGLDLEVSRLGGRERADDGHVAPGHVLRHSHVHERGARAGRVHLATVRPSAVLFLLCLLLLYDVCQCLYDVCQVLKVVGSRLTWWTVMETVPSAAAAGRPAAVAATS